MKSTRPAIIARPVRRGLAACMLLVASLVGRSLTAQVEVNYGPGAYGEYRRELAAFALRSNELVADIGRIEIRREYCTAAERNEPGRALAEARTRLSALERDWNAFKSRINRIIQTAAGLALFTSMDANTGSLNFWVMADREIIGHPTADREAKVAQQRLSRVIDCNRRPAPEPPRTAGPSPATNPLAGLTRPAVPAAASLTALPPPFCTVTERIEWLKANLDAPMQALIDASFALNNYAVQVSEALDNARARRDTAAERALKAELDWAAAAHDAADKRYWEMARLRDATTVIDCTPPKPATDPTTPVRTETAPPKDRQVGVVPTIQWRIGGGLEYSSYNQFEKTAGAQPNLTEFTGKSGTIGLGVSVSAEYRGWEVGLSAHRNTLTLTQAYASGVGSAPTKVTGTLEGTFLDVSVGPRLSLGMTKVWTYVGIGYAINVYDFLAQDDVGNSWDGSRSLQAVKGHAGLFVDLPITRRIGGRLGATYTTSGKSGDADANSRFLLGTMYSF